MTKEHYLGQIQYLQLSMPKEPAIGLVFMTMGLDVIAESKDIDELRLNVIAKEIVAREVVKVVEEKYGLVCKLDEIMKDIISKLSPEIAFQLWGENKKEKKAGREANYNYLLN